MIEGQAVDATPTVDGSERHIDLLLYI